MSSAFDGIEWDFNSLHADGGVRTIEHHAEIGSTNDQALTLATDPLAQLPLLVLADRQTAGRGRGANAWWAAAGSLTFSLVIETTAANIPASRWPQLSLTTGLAVCEALAGSDGAFRSALAVKWPNDVYLGGRKACGILIESPAIRDRLVIGVGVNVNNSFATAPAELRATSTALCDFSNEQHDLNHVLLAILQQINRRWQQLAGEGFNSIVIDYRQKCLLTGRTLQLQSGGQPHAGRCLGIDDQGALLLQTEAGLSRFHSATITRIDA